MNTQIRTAVIDGFCWEFCSHLCNTLVHMLASNIFYAEFSNQEAHANEEKNRSAAGNSPYKAKVSEVGQIVLWRLYEQLSPCDIETLHSNGQITHVLPSEVDRLLSAGKMFLKLMLDKSEVPTT